MATIGENLETAIAAIAAAIAANPTAVSYSIDGQSVNHGELHAKLAALMELRIAANGPLEEISEGHV